MLLLWGAFLNQLIHKEIKSGTASGIWTSYWLLWLGFIVVNIVYLKFFALPSKKIMKAVSPDSEPEDMTWSMIEETLEKKESQIEILRTLLEKENIKLKTVLDSLLDPVFIYNSELKIIYANQAFFRHFNYPSGQLPVDLIEINRNLDFKDLLLSAVNSNKLIHKAYFTFGHIQDPHRSYFDIKILPHQDLNGQLCIMHDSTSRKMADLMREDFVSNFSHEVRTPLTILNGQLQALKSQINNESFERIENNSRRLLNLFNDLLRLTSVEKRLELKKEDIFLPELLENLTHELMVNYPQKKIHFSYELKQETMPADYNLFEQALLNLIDNSLKYSPENGKVTFKSYQQIINGEKNYMLEISDTGIGIPEDQLHRIFERFFRVDTSRSSEIQGTGLGLAIVKHIIVKHGGKIRASSVEGQGTTFIISLPDKEA